MPIRLPEELQYIQNSVLPQKSTDARMDGKVCVITGATSGIGYLTVRRLARGGARPVLVCRNAEKGRALQDELTRDFGAKSDLFIADFQRLAEVRDAALAIREAHPQVHILINNAGLFNKRRRLTPDGNEMVFQVIHLAGFLLTHLLLPALKKGAPARVIDVSSEAHRFGGLNLNDLNWKKRPYIGLRAYGAAKIAQVLTMRQLAEEVKDSGVAVNAMHPGAVRTNIGMNNNIVYRLYSKYILRWFLRDPNTSAEAIYYLCAAPELAGVTGSFFNQTIEEKPASYILKPGRQQAVWDASMELVRPFLSED